MLAFFVHITVYFFRQYLTSLFFVLKAQFSNLLKFYIVFKNRKLIFFGM